MRLAAMLWPIYKIYFVVSMYTQLYKISYVYINVWEAFSK